MDIQQAINDIAKVLINDVDNKEILMRSVAELADITDEICFYRGIRRNSKGFWYINSKIAPKRLDGKESNITDDSDEEPTGFDDIESDEEISDNSEAEPTGFDDIVSDDNEDLLEPEKPLKKRVRIEPDKKTST